MAFRIRNTFIRPDTDVHWMPDGMRTSDYNSIAESVRSSTNVTQTRREISEDNLTFIVENSANSEADWEDYQTGMSMTWTNAGFLDWLLENGVSQETEILENT